MNQSEFLTQLRDALDNELNSSAVQENINYYKNYITEEIRSGKSEEEVLNMLGDPWVLARNIIDSPGGSQSAGGSYTYEPAGSDQPQRSESGNNQPFRIFGTGSWLKLLLGILVVIGIVVLVFSLFVGMVSMFLPILIPILVVVFIVRLFSRR